ncbi:hypothetical protein O9929_25875 [Vibrio lentus]|nr:hypothetical protein [Vibrio lentus]
MLKTTSWRCNKWLLLAPNAGKPVSMAYVRTDLAAIGTEVFADVRGAKLPMTVEKMPFVPQRYYRG